jgi:hypothetical protein
VFEFHPALTLMREWNEKLFKKRFSKSLDTILFCCYTIKVSGTKTIYAGVAQQVEQLTCNQQVGGSIPSTSSKEKTLVV